MALERACNRREVLFAGAAMGVAWVCGGCTDDEEDDPLFHSLRYADAGLEQGFQSMYGHLPPEDGAVLDNEILKRKDLLIHVFRWKLSPEESRGGASTLASNARKDGLCSPSLHPGDKGIRGRRNWDLMYDGPLAEDWAKESGIPNPIEAILYHEIFGHILRILRNPELLGVFKRDKRRYDIFEDEARIIENQYRMYRGLPEVPAVLPKPKHPKP